MKCEQGRFLHYSLSWNVSQTFEELEVKRSVMTHRVYGDTPTFISITGVCTLMIVHSVFSVMAALIVEMLFMLFSVYNTA